MIDLPAWAHTIRPAQQVAVEQIVRRFESGTRVVILDAPTGSGKTLVAELVRRALNTRALYVCVDRGLQDQVLRDFDYCKVIKGRRNYPTLDRPHAFPEISAEDCTSTPRRPCDWCHDRSQCPYFVAKQEALAADLACANVSYLITEANGAGKFSKRPLVIADEADRLESVIMGHVTATLSARRLKDLGLVPLSADEKVEGLAHWLQNDVLPAIDREIELLTLGDPDEEDYRVTRRKRAWIRLFDKLADAADELPTGQWVTTEETVTRGEDVGTNLVFKPIRIDDVTDQLLWRHGKRWLLMSATVLNPGGLVRDLGIPSEEWAVVRMASTFPAERRPIYPLSVTPVTAKTVKTAVPLLGEALLKILAQHPDERILVHTVSFKLMDALHETPVGDDPRCLWYLSANSRAEILDQYLSTKAAVLFAPSLERGLDLPDDACRVVVVAKVPYPDLGDKQIHARLYNTVEGQGWYRDQTLRSLVQMTGRGMRHQDDYCVTYLLDAQFDTVLARHRGHLPAWWVEAIQ